MMETKETKEKTREKYVTEDMLERALGRFRKDIAEDTKNIVDASITVAIEASENRLGLIMLKHFDRLDKKIDDGLVAVDDRFDAMDHRFDAMDMRFDRLELRFDNHLLDCITWGEHKKLEKRVDGFELFKRKLAM